MYDTNEILPRIKSLCDDRKWSLYRLAKEAGLRYSTVNNLFTRYNLPSIPTLICICNAFGISLSDFFSADEEEIHTLNPEQEQLLKNWNRLSRYEKKLLSAYMSGLLKDSE